MTEEKYKEILAAHALDALDENERRELDARLAEDASLRGEFNELRDVAAALSYAAEQLEPSPEVRSQILERIKNSSPIVESPQKLTLVRGGASPALEKLAMSDVITPSRSFWSYVPAVGAIAASIAALVLAASLYNAVNDNKAKNDQLAELNQRLVSVEQKLSDTQAQLERNFQERDLLGSPNSLVIELTGTGVPATAKARLVLDRATGRAMVFVEGLPPAPNHKAYQFWFISDPKNPFPGAVFSTNESGNAIFRDNMPAKFLKSSAFAITLEPETGSPAPTGKPFLSAKL